MTKVDEWIREETGVGAAIAAGSQALSGIWALLVKALVKGVKERIMVLYNILIDHHVSTTSLKD